MPKRIRVGTFKQNRRLIFLLVILFSVLYYIFRLSYPSVSKYEFDEVKRKVPFDFTYCEFVKAYYYGGSLGTCYAFFEIDKTNLTAFISVNNLKDHLDRYESTLTFLVQYHQELEERDIKGWITEDFILEMGGYIEPKERIKRLHGILVGEDARLSSINKYGIYVVSTK